MRAGIVVGVVAALCAAAWFALMGGGANQEASPSRETATDARAPLLTAPSVAETSTQPAPNEAEPSAETGAAREAAKPDPTFPAPSAREVLVRAIGRAGAPVADVPLRVGCDGGAERSANELLPRTGEDGLARLGEAMFGQTFGAYGPDAVFTFDLALPLSNRVVKRIRAAELFAAPIDLTLPAYGEIELEFVRDARRINELARVILMPSFEVFGGRIGDSSVTPQRIACDTSDGLARFATLPTGSRFFALLEIGTETHKVPEPIDGPAADGDIVRRTIDLGAAVRIAFRLLSAQGEPVRDAEVRITRFTLAKTGPSFGVGEIARSDASGRVVTPWPEPFPEGGKIRLGVDVEATSERSESQAERLGHVEFERTESFQPGLNELGDLKLVARPLLVAGRVVSAKGHPIADAQVRTYQRVAEPTPSWEALGGSAMATDDGGNFEIYATTELTQLGLRATSEAFAPGEIVATTPGATGVELVLASGGTVVATVDRPDFVPAESLEGSLRPRGEVAEFTIPCQRVGDSLRFEHLAPGAYDFELAVGAVSRIHRVENVIVSDDATTDDPRLKDIAIASHLKEIRVKIVDADGAPIPGARAEALAIDGSGWRPGGVDATGTTRVIVAAAGQTIVARADGFRPALRDRIREDVTIALARDLDIVLRVRGDVSLAKDNELLLASLEPIGGIAAEVPDSLGGGRIAEQSFATGREAAIRTPWPGRYRVEWHQSRTTQQVMMQFGRGGTQEVELLDTPQRQVIELDPPKDGIIDFD